VCQGLWLGAEEGVAAPNKKIENNPMQSRQQAEHAALFRSPSFGFLRTAQLSEKVVERCPSPEIRYHEFRPLPVKNGKR
jgi:hypothetical protein